MNGSTPRAQTFQQPHKILSRLLPLAAACCAKSPWQYSLFMSSPSPFCHGGVGGLRSAGFSPWATFKAICGQVPASCRTTHLHNKNPFHRPSCFMKPQFSLTLNESCCDSGLGSHISLISEVSESTSCRSSLTGRGLVVTFPVAGQEATEPETVLTTTW